MYPRLPTTLVLMAFTEPPLFYSEFYTTQPGQPFFEWFWKPRVYISCFLLSSKHLGPVRLFGGFHMCSRNLNGEDMEPEHRPCCKTRFSRLGNPTVRLTVWESEG